MLGVCDAVPSGVQKPFKIPGDEVLLLRRAAEVVAARGGVPFVLRDDEVRAGAHAPGLDVAGSTAPPQKL